MKNIVALIDFTPASNVVVKFAKNLAHAKNANVILLSVLDINTNTVPEKTKQDMLGYENELRAAGVSCRAEYFFGNFFSTVGGAVLKVHASLVLIGTHGKIGLKQNLFGSNVLRLVKILQMPALVLQEDSVWPEGGFKNVFFSIATHSRFGMKAEQTKQVVAEDAHITMYVIDRAGDLDEQLRRNIKLCENKFNELNLKYNIVEEDATVYSVGFSRQSLEFIKNSPPDLISIMSQVSKINSYFGNVDKENIILNEFGIPVLCCNDHQEHF